MMQIRQDSLLLFTDFYLHGIYEKNSEIIYFKAIGT